jgi:hypothetical protein
VIPGVLSFVTALGVVVYAASRQLELTAVVGIVGALGCLLLLFMLWRRAEDVLAWVILLLGLAYVLTIVVHAHGVDEAAPLVAAALLLCAELAVWSCGEHARVRPERGVVVARAIALGALVVAGLGVSALVVALTAAPVGGSFGWTALGALAAVAVVALTLRLTR